MNQQDNSWLRWTVLSAIFVALFAAVLSSAQSAAPPTARQAAADPAFASRLHPPAGGAHLSRSPHRRMPASPQDQTLYDNGPYNGTTDAWSINFGFSVSDSFTVPTNSSITGIHFVYWDASTTDLLTSVDMALGSTSFGGTFQTLTGVTNTFLGINQYGYALYQADYTFRGVPGSGSGYVTLQNACTTSGCSVTNPVYWDENSGPSTAYENTLGSIPSETFTLTGSGGGPACYQDQPGSGFNTIYSFTDLPNQAYPVGVILDQAGNLYGTANYGLLDGLVYQLAPTASGWALNLLYRLAGGPDGNTPSPWIAKGPDGGVYGTSDGGVQGCGYYCGQVFRLRPGPTACRTSSCGWIENVLYQFTGGSDGWVYDYSGGVVFDQAGNLYGASENGGGTGCGGRGCGTVYQLTPSVGGWTEKVLYRFTGGTDGQSPSQVLVGTDGNLYGVAAGGAYGSGVVFQLTPSGSGWTQSVVHAFQLATEAFNPSSLGTDSFGNLYGIATAPDTFPVVFQLSRSGTTWVLAEREFHHAYVNHEFLNNLIVDPAGNVYVTGGGSESCLGHNCDGATGYQPYFVSYIAWENFGGYGGDLVFFEEQLFSSGGPMALDAEGNLYGTDPICGAYNQGAVWKLSHQ